MATISNGIFLCSDPNDVNASFEEGLNAAGAILAAPLGPVLATGASTLYSAPLAITAAPPLGNAPFTNWPFFPEDPPSTVGPEDPELGSMLVEDDRLIFIFRTR